MANIMSLKSIRNKPSRNGFDLSFKKNFTAKAGELLPVMVKEVLPGDTFKINLKAFTRTQPVNTAAFARIREYYDFFYVPYDLLWNKSNTLLTQMLDNPQHAVSLDPASLPCLSRTGLSPSLAGLPRTVLLGLVVDSAVRTPECTHSGLGSFPFARRYLGNRQIFFLFLRLLRCFSSPGSLRIPMDSVYGD